MRRQGPRQRGGSEGASGPQSIGSNREKGKEGLLPRHCVEEPQLPGTFVVWHPREREGQQQGPKLHIPRQL